MASEYSVSTRNRIKSALKSFFYWVFQIKLIHFNPAALIVLEKQVSKKTIPFKPCQVFKLLDTILQSEAKTADRDAALFAIYAFTGIRRSAALLLTSKDYNRKQKLISVHNTKSKMVYQVPVSSLLEGILEHYFSKRTKYNKNQDSYLFLSTRTGSALSNRAVNKRFEKWKTIAKIPENLTIHSFRSGFATQLYKFTKDTLLISKALGHSSINSTRRYVPYDFQYLRASINIAYSNDSLSVS